MSNSCQAQSTRSQQLLSIAFLPGCPLSLRRRPRRSRVQIQCMHIGRRTTLQILGALLATCGHLRAAEASFDIWPFSKSSRPVGDKGGGKKVKEGYTVFEVKGSDVADVNLEPMTSSEALDDLAQCDAVFLGEKHNSLADHALQARIIEGLWERREKERSGDPAMVVGLEQVQKKFQFVLDDYIERRGVGEEDLFYGTEWEQRWVWPFETYLPIFRVCRALKIPMIALSVDAETLGKVRSGGLENLSTSELHEFIPHPEVFAAISREAAFKAYVDKSIIPSYGAHVKLGLLGSHPSFNLFYSTRVLRDEVMASTAANYLERHPDALLVGLAGSDHIKFLYGVPLRMERQLIAKEAERIASLRAEESTPKSKQVRKPKVKTVMLNPTPNDAINPRDSSLMLELIVDKRYTRRSQGDSSKDLLLISDLLWFSSSETAHPRRKATPKFPPVEELVFPEVSVSMTF